MDSNFKIGAKTQYEIEEDVMIHNFVEARRTAAVAVVAAVNSNIFCDARLRSVLVRQGFRSGEFIEDGARTFPTREIVAADIIMDHYFGRGWTVSSTPDYERADIEWCAQTLADDDLSREIEPSEEAEMNKCRAACKAALATLLEHNAFLDWATIRLLVTGGLSAQEVREYMRLD